MDFEVYLQKDLRYSANPQALQPDHEGYVIVDEYESWVIRPNVPLGEGVYLRCENNYIQLDWNRRLKGFVWPREERYRKLKSTTGELRFYQRALSDNYRPLLPILVIAAGSLSEKEYVLLLARLGELATSTLGFVTAPVNSGVPMRTANNETGHWLNMPTIRYAQSILEYFSVFRQQWPLILSQPATQVKRTIQPVKTTASLALRSFHTLRNTVISPDRKYIWLSCLSEDIDTPENRFIAFALYILKDHTEGLRKELEKLAERLVSPTVYSRDYDLPLDAGEVAKQRWYQGRTTAKQAAEELQNLAVELAEARDWADRQLKTSLMRKNTAITASTSQPSLRLTRSPGYGAICAAYRHLSIKDDTQIKLDKIRHALVERTVRNTHELYEMWVFLEIYARLVERFGFYPEGDQPLVHLEMQDGRLLLQGEQTFKLRLHLNNDPENKPDYHISLKYIQPVEVPPCTPEKRCFINDICLSLPCYTLDAKIYYPDFVLETEYDGKECHFALDAKYRRYGSQRSRKDDEEKFH